MHVSIKGTSLFLLRDHTTQVSWARTTGWFALTHEGNYFCSKLQAQLLWNWNTTEVFFAELQNKNKCTVNDIFQIKSYFLKLVLLK